ncbi:MAG: sulfotransferase [Pseudomonadota bacterium]
MLKLFVVSHLRLCKLWLQCALTPGRGWIRLLLVLIWPLFIVLQFGHWLAFLADELLFRGYRKVAITRPLFVVGPPRSGTTHLHHVLSADADTTTFSLWECLFGLSVTAKKLVVLLIAIDRRSGRPFGRLIDFCERRWLSAMEDVHPLRLNAPEEDFLAFMPLAQCFILIVIFPKAEWLWRTARLDVEMSASEREVWADWYRLCVQKHLYVFGADKTFLSKNASFSGSVKTLLQTFPDASLIVCSRNPLKTVPSQLSSLLPGLHAAGFKTLDPNFKQGIIELLEFYYLHLYQVAQEYSRQMAFIDNAALRNDLAQAVTSAFVHLGRPLSDEFAARLDRADQQSRSSSSGHRYRLEDFDLNEQQIRHRFAAVYERYRFAEGEAVLR